jgi:hypothetical protein
MRVRRAFVLGLAFVFAAGAADAQKLKAPVAIDIAARPVEAFDPRDPKKIRFGQLEFRGGLVLQSAERNFGGISGLLIRPGGKDFVAITDRGNWLTGTFRFDGDRVTGIENAILAPMLGPTGRPLGATRWFDTESVAADGDTFYVGIERANRILRYRFGEDGTRGRGSPIAVPRGIRDLPHNQGIEGLAFVPAGQPLAGSLIAISERGLDDDGNIRGFILGGKTPGSFAVRRIGKYDITDLAIAPSGHLIVVERYFSWLAGINLRIRAIPLAAIRPGATVDGEILLDAPSGHRIDNMEALAITVNAGGETIFTLISDDNFSRWQQTMLLRFAWIRRQQ